MQGQRRCCSRRAVVTARAQSPQAEPLVHQREAPALAGPDPKESRDGPLQACVPRQPAHSGRAHVHEVADAGAVALDQVGAVEAAQRVPSHWQLHPVELEQVVQRLVVDLAVACPAGRGSPRAAAWACWLQHRARPGTVCLAGAAPVGRHGMAAWCRDRPGTETGACGGVLPAGSWGSLDGHGAASGALGHLLKEVHDRARDDAVVRVACSQARTSPKCPGGQHAAGARRRRSCA